LSLVGWDGMVYRRPLFDWQGELEVLQLSTTLDEAGISKSKSGAGCEVHGEQSMQVTALEADLLCQY
jgi:hypothetical protein